MINLGNILLNKIFIILSLYLISACSNNNYLILDNHGEKITASFIQWNNEYAVTVKHIPRLNNYVYISDIYDIQFFKNKSKNTPKWNNLKENERIIMAGFYNGNYTEIESEDIGIYIKPKGYFIPVYRAGNGEIKPGMSGGAVLNLNNEVVGMNVGFSKEEIYYKNKYTKISIFIPYKVINSEWKKFKGNQYEQ